MKKKFKIDNKEIELDLEPGNCEECYYNRFCTYLEDPFNLGYADFQDFCMDYIQNEGMNDYRPAPRTLEENILFIFPEVICDKIKDKQEIEDTILNFCKSFCIVDCTDICPLKKYKNEKNN